MLTTAFRLRRPALAVLLFVCLAPVAGASPIDDRLLAEYVQAIMEQKLNLQGVTVEVSDEAITIRGPALTTDDEDRIEDALSGISDGDRRIRVNGEPIRKWFWFSNPELFAPLLADPRWPRFSAAFQHYVDDSQLRNVGAVSFGGSFPILRYSPDADWHLLLGFQAAVFSVFDFDADSTDLVNSDFWVGVPVSFRWADFSVIGRIFHQSSHLGDEFLLRNQVDRVNLSYEAVDLIFSYDFGPKVDQPRGFETRRVFRLYGGGGVLLRKEPADLDRLWAHGGAEIKSPEVFFKNWVRPIAAADFQSNQEYDWDVDISVRAGVQLENSDKPGRQVQVLFVYFNGRSPNGQFYERTIEYLGLEGRLRF